MFSRGITIFLLTLSLLLFGCTSNKPQVDKHEKKITPSQVIANKEYDSLLSRVKQYAESADLPLLRTLYTKTSYYQPVNANIHQRAVKIFTYIEKKEWQTCSKLASSILDDEYTNLSAHYGAMICALQRGNILDGAYHKKILDGFIQSIWRTGTGEHKEQALEVITHTEMYGFIQLHGLVPIEQDAIILDSGKHIEAFLLNSTQPPHEKIYWYFSPLYR